MREIKPNLIPELSEHRGQKKISEVGPYDIFNYRELVKILARLAYENKDHLLFFRGQSEDHLNKANSSTIYPSIYRSEHLSVGELRYRFRVLEAAAKQLKELFVREKLYGYEELRKKPYVQYSILQHYMVCRTPLLDLTQSIRVACSFAQLFTSKNYAFIYVIGLPYITNRISINSEHDIVNIRLLSISPPDALRPYFQDGYLAGTTDITTEYSSDKTELDFNNRLIAEFRIPNNDIFWGRGFSIIPEEALLPANDKVKDLCESITTDLSTSYQSAELGEFIEAWSVLEKTLLSLATTSSKNVRTVVSASAIIKENFQASQELLNLIDNIRRFRNEVIHGSRRTNSIELLKQLENIKNVQSQVEGIIKRGY